jgi:hypothetical protein
MSFIFGVGQMRASWSVEDAIYQALGSSSDLVALLNDDALQAGSDPLISLGQSVVRDCTLGTLDSADHLLTLHVRSQKGGKARAAEIIEAIRAALHDQPLISVDHQLIHLHHEFSETRRDPDDDTYHGIVRYRAMTHCMAMAA